MLRECYARPNAPASAPATPSPGRAGAATGPRSMLWLVQAGGRATVTYPQLLSPSCWNDEPGEQAGVVIYFTGTPTQGGPSNTFLAQREQAKLLSLAEAAKLFSTSPCPDPAEQELELSLF